MFHSSNRVFHLKAHTHTHTHTGNIRFVSYGEHVIIWIYVLITFQSFLVPRSIALGTGTLILTPLMWFSLHVCPIMFIGNNVCHNLSVLEWAIYFWHIFIGVMSLVEDKMVPVPCKNNEMNNLFETMFLEFVDIWTCKNIAYCYSK